MTRDGSIARIGQHWARVWEARALVRDFQQGERQRHGRERRERWLLLGLAVIAAEAVAVAVLVRWY